MKKNTRKWCKGKIGIEHKPIWVESRGSVFIARFSCQACSKIIDYYVDVESFWKYEKPVIGTNIPLKEKDEKNKMR